MSEPMNKVCEAKVAVYESCGFLMLCEETDRGPGAVLASDEGPGSSARISASLEHFARGMFTRANRKFKEGAKAEAAAIRESGGMP